MPANSLFNRDTYDRDAAQYSAVTSPPDHSASSDDEDADVLREEEEREKLLAGGLFTRSGSIRIGKKVRGGRRRTAGDVAESMGGKRLGMEDGGEYGLNDSDDDEPEFDEKTPEVKVLLHSFL